MKLSLPLSPLRALPVLGMAALLVVDLMAFLRREHLAAVPPDERG